MPIVDFVGSKLFVFRDIPAYLPFLKHTNALDQRRNEREISRPRKLLPTSVQLNGTLLPMVVSFRLHWPAHPRGQGHTYFSRLHSTLSTEKHQATHTYHVQIAVDEYSFVTTDVRARLDAMKWMKPWQNISLTAGSRNGCMSKAVQSTPAEDNVAIADSLPYELRWTASAARSKAVSANNKIPKIDAGQLLGYFPTFVTEALILEHPSRGWA
ncbi:uncharacterized protein CLUP02_00946 [Colletotrichum lupini]|uniref:Uncharacterized protein n=1 Tax=Colletotrichum lupini TaxID=145971 RepID=A0A9Q8SC22_9PEZI|nr:uncharacterized protein CLUP02_00946 [Colletotrichum lupini]UQC74298.1 hypothetical protein CLUP02_00946 [Colletotrichum lupini]